MEVCQKNFDIVALLNTMALQQIFFCRNNSDVKHFIVDQDYHWLAS